MLKEKNSSIRKVQQLLDVLLTVAAFLIAYGIRDRWNMGLGPLLPLKSYLFLLYIIVPLWLFLLMQSGAYLSVRTINLSGTVRPVLKSILVGGFVLMAVLFVFKIAYISRSLIILFLAADALLIFSLRAAVYFLLHYIRKRGYNYRTVVIVGTGSRAMEFAELIERNSVWGMRMLGFVDTDRRRVGASLGGHRVIGTVERLKDIILAVPVDEVIFVVPRSWLHGMEMAILDCEKIGVKVLIAADFYPTTIARTGLTDMGGWPLLTLNPVSHIEEAIIMKRAFDIALSLTLLMLSLPLFLLVTAGIKLSSRGAVFFRQQRCGRNGRTFNLLKFRTMVSDAEKRRGEVEHLNEMKGPVFKIKNDPRVTLFGRFLRKYSIDELPQLINVLKGDMSLVGPRPPLPKEVKLYDFWQRRRLSVRPGITCSWQVNGRNKLNFDEWMKLDLEYIDNWSIKEDLKIMLKTIPAVFRGTGV